MKRWFYLNVLNRCPKCKCSSIAWGQWNDGNLAGKPVCFNPNCPKPSPYESHYTGRRKRKFMEEARWGIRP